MWFKRCYVVFLNVLCTIYMHGCRNRRMKVWRLEYGEWGYEHCTQTYLTCSPQNILFSSVRKGLPASFLPASLEQNTWNHGNKHVTRISRGHCLHCTHTSCAGILRTNVWMQFTNSIKDMFTSTCNTCNSGCVHPDFQSQASIEFILRRSVFKCVGSSLFTTLASKTHTLDCHRVMHTTYMYMYLVHNIIWCTYMYILYTDRQTRMEPRKVTELRHKYIWHTWTIKWAHHVNHWATFSATNSSLLPRRFRLQRTAAMQCRLLHAFAGLAQPAQVPVGQWTGKNSKTVHLFAKYSKI